MVNAGAGYGTQTVKAKKQKTRGKQVVERSGIDLICKSVPK